jgi:hypothetical protein
MQSKKNKSDIFPKVFCSHLYLFFLLNSSLFTYHIIFAYIFSATARTVAITGNIIMQVKSIIMSFKISHTPLS